MLTVCAMPLLAQQNPVFQPKRTRDYNDRAAEGKCTLRVRVDDEIDVELRGGSVTLRTVAGRPGRDEGSECSQSLPAGGFTKFNFRGIDGRGEVRLVQEPRLGNNWTAIVAIRDKRGGDEGYTFELTWASTGTYPSTGSYQSGGLSNSQPSYQPYQQSGGILPSLSGTTQQRQGGFTGFNDTVQGSGTMQAGSQQSNLRRMRVNIQQNGNVDLQVFADEVYSLGGRWSGSGDTLDVQITNGFGNAGAGGGGRIYLSNGRVIRVDLSGTSGRFPQGFSVRFEAQ